MWRTRAVRSLLAEEVAGLRPAPEDAAALERRLDRATRRAGWVVALDWAAILVLLLLRPADRGGFFLGASEETVLGLGLLAVAVHSGFRLGQLEKYRAVSRLLRDLEERAPDPGE